jgi:very-short-patch-repair endonuclease
MNAQLPQVCCKCRKLKHAELGRFVKTKGRWNCQRWICSNCDGKQVQVGKWRRQSPPEKQAAEALLKTGYRFIREFAVGFYHFDLAIPAIRLLIEIDSWSYHRKNWQKERDQRKQELAESKGWKVARVECRDDVAGRVRWHVDVRETELGATDPGSERSHQRDLQKAE